MKSNFIESCLILFFFQTIPFDFIDDLRAENQLKANRIM